MTVLLKDNTSWQLIEIDALFVTRVARKLQPIATSHALLREALDAFVDTRTVRDGRRVAAVLRAFKQWQPLNRPLLRVVDDCLGELHLMLPKR